MGEFKYYFLFGTGAITVFNNSSIKEFIKIFKSKPDIGELVLYDEIIMFPEDLLDCFKKWDNYIFLNKKDFLHIKRHIHGK